MLDALSTSAAIAAARPSIAVLPIGSIEQHSRHLPLGTDWIAATALAHRVASELDAYLLPALPVSMGRCHKPMAGTVWLRPMTLAAAVMDIVRSLAASGIHQVVIVNGHGGNFTLEVAVARAEPRASRADRAAAAHEPALERAADLRDGGHGGACRRVGDVGDDGHRRLAGRRRPRRLHPAPSAASSSTTRSSAPSARKACGASRAWPRARRGNGPSTRACTRWWTTSARRSTGWRGSRDAGRALHRGHPGPRGPRAPGGWLELGPVGHRRGPQCAVHHVRGRARAPAHRAPAAGRGRGPWSAPARGL